MGGLNDAGDLVTEVVIQGLSWGRYRCSHEGFLEGSVGGCYIGGLSGFNGKNLLFTVLPDMFFFSQV